MHSVCVAHFCFHRLCGVIHCQYDHICALAVNFGGALTCEPSLTWPLGWEHTPSIALVVGSGALICGFVTSALYKHDIIHVLPHVQPFTQQTLYTVWCCVHNKFLGLNYVLCLFFFCAGTHSCTRGHTHLGVLALCVYVCVPSSWFTATSMLWRTFFTVEVLQFTVHLDWVLLLSCLT